MYFICTSFGANNSFLTSESWRPKMLALFAVLGICIWWFCSYFIRTLVQPLNSFNDQMEGITETNLNARIPLTASQNELNRTARSFNEMLDRLQQAFEFQKSFVHHASHELRTPLASMLAQTEAALKRNLTADEFKLVLQSLREDQQEMIDLTNSLLLLSQYEKITSNEGWPLVRIDEILYDIITVMKRTFTNINISVEFLYMPDNDVYLSVKGNDALLKSAFRNLIKNAYQYSEDRTVEITIEANEAGIALHFENQGRQISADDQARLFIPFFRGQNAQREKGFGLGLSIVKRIIVLHQGSITYTPVAAERNKFSIEFLKHESTQANAAIDALLNSR